MRRGKWLTPGGEFGYEWSADGKYLVGSGGGNLWYLRAEESGSGSEKVMFLDTSFDALSPDLSPDAGFLAYESNDSGRCEVCVRIGGKSCGPRAGLKSPKTNYIALVHG